MRIGVVVMFAAGILAASLPALADDGAVGYRQKVMDAVGGTMEAMVAIAKQEVPHSAHLAVHARNMAALATVVNDVFPPGSGEGDTEALPEIWSQPEAFKQRLDRFGQAARDLDAVVSSGDMSGFGEALGALGQSCKGCHDDFKAD
jgi:cytochrome c556